MVPAVASDSPYMPPESPFLTDIPGGKSDKMDEPDLGSGDRTGLLVMRAWVEEGSAEPLRVHVRLTTDVSKGYQRTMNFCDVKAASATVEAWLTDMMADPTSPE
jgi:hypothetical protein